MATEKRLIEANADGCNEIIKIKTHHARIVVDGTADKPYYSIEWFDPTKKEYYLGYSSYFIEFVFNWLSECFEIVDAPTVDAVEVVHGVWMDFADSFDKRRGRMDLRCSVCRNRASKFVYGTEDWWDGCKPNYCPNCGAKMDKNENM